MLKKRRQQGFSLIELSITVAVAALILTVGVPGFQSLSQENHASAHLDELNNGLRLARHLAVEHQRKAKICARDPNQSSPECSGNTSGWENGWVVMLEDPADPNGWADIMSNFHSPDDTTWSISSASSVTSEIVFRSTGTLDVSTMGTSAIVTIVLGDCTKSTTVSLSGSLTFGAYGCDES